jgi:capsule polysaccharide export protein KpsC/LpsZ
MEIDDITKGNAVQFINKCEEIYCLNSSVGIEAILLGRKAKIFGDSPFKNVCSMNEDLQIKALNFIVFGYLIHKELLFNDSYYKYRLANRGNEKAIYLDNVKRLLEKAK